MRDPVRWIVVAILLLALGLRLGFVLAMPATPLFWDEPFYSRWGASYASGFFAWLGGGGSGPFLEAFRTSLLKSETYSAAIGAVYAVCGVQPRAVLIVQALLDTGSCLFVFGLTRAVGGTPAGIAALALAALYEPLIYSAGRLQTETFASFLYLGGLWAVLVATRRRPWSFVGGLLIAITTLARQALAFLFPVLVVAVPIRNWDLPPRQRVRVTLVFAAGFFALMGPQLVLTRVLAGEALWSGRADPAIDMYGGAIYRNAGWKSDRLSFAHPPTGELRAVMGSDSTRSPTTAEYRAATFRTWRWHPFESAAVTLHKLYVAWLYPYNDVRWTFLTTAAGQAAYHRIILILALIGMPLVLHRWRVGVPLILSTLYLWLSYVVVKIEVRYAILPMPLMICFAGVAVARVGSGWQRAWHAGARTRLICLTLAGVVAVVAACMLTIGRILALLPVTVGAAHGLRTAGVLVAVIAVAYVTAELVHDHWRRATALAALASSAVVATLVVLFGRPLDETWHEWQSTLRPNRGVASQAFLVPDDIGRPAAAALRLDLLPDLPGEHDIVVRMNGQELKRYRGGLTRGDADLPQDRYFQESYVVRRRTREPDKAWYTIPIPVELISPRQRLDVDVALEGPDAARGGLTIFGDYTPDATGYAGPSLFSPALTADTSVFKYLGDDDFRLRRHIDLSGSSHSRFRDGGDWSDRDLGTDPGLQQGRYRIFLLIKNERGMVIL